VQLHDLRGLSVLGREPGQGLVEGKQSFGLRLPEIGDVGQLDALPVAAPFRAAFAAGVVDEDAAHRESRRRGEMRASLPLRVDVGADEPDECVVHESRRLQRLAGSLLVEKPGGETAQLVVDERHEPIGRVGFVADEGVENPGHLAHAAIISEATNGYHDPRTFSRETRMRIGYDIRLEDLYAVQRHYYDHAAPIRRAVRWRQGVGVLLSLSVMLVASAFFPHNVWPFYLGGSLLAVFFLFAAPFLWRSAYMRAIRRQYAGAASKGLVGSYLLEIAGDDLVSTNAVRQVRTRISSIDRIEEDDKRTYVFTTAINAHVIPYEAVAEGDAAEFVAILKDRMSIASGGPPLSESVRRSAESGTNRS
jgi:hypothetical protein